MIGALFCLIGVFFSIKRLILCKKTEDNSLVRKSLICYNCGGYTLDLLNNEVSTQAQRERIIKKIKQTGDFYELCPSCKRDDSVKTLLGGKVNHKFRLFLYNTKKVILVYVLICAASIIFYILGFVYKPYISTFSTIAGFLTFVCNYFFYYVDRKTRTKKEK